MQQKKSFAVNSEGIRNFSASAVSENRETVSNLIRLLLHSLLVEPMLDNVSYIVGEKTTVYEISVEQSDFGRLLGTKGKNISALRTLVASMATNLGFRAIVTIKDEDKFFNRRES